MQFNQLISLIEKTHTRIQGQISATINHWLVLRNWLMGFYIVEFEQHGEDRAKYGQKLIESIARELKKKNLKGLSATNLKLCRQFYEVYPQIGQIMSDQLSDKKVDEASRTKLAQLKNAISQPLSEKPETIIGQMASDQFKSKFQLSWSHYVFLLKIDDENERRFYEIEASKENWSLPELRRQFNSSLYERLALSRNTEQIKVLSRNGLIISKPEDALKDPYVLEFLGLKEESTYTESDLETAIIDKLENFLLELGKGFLFEARQKRFTFDDKHFWVDLVFYNRFLRCFVLIDLKIGELTHQDLGQIQMYVNYYDRHIKTDEESKTVGIVLCKQKNESLVQITLPEDNDQIFARKYQLYLPTKEELKRQMEV